MTIGRIPFAGLSRDHTLRIAEEFFAAVRDHAQFGVCLTDHEGRFFYANRRYLDLYGYQEEELLGQPFTIVLPEDARAAAQALHQEFLAGRCEELPAVWTVQRKDGTQFRLSVTAGRGVGADGTPFKITMVIDVTEMDRAQQEAWSLVGELEQVSLDVARKNDRLLVLNTELRRQKQAVDEANATKARFIATINHELRTPLNAIMGFADVIREQALGPVGNPAYVDYARHILNSGAHLMDMIDNVLDLSRLESGHWSLHCVTTDVGPLLDQACTMLHQRAEAKGIVLHQDVPAPLPQIVADQRVLLQCLLNLLSNALKFTPAQGTVTLRAWAETKAGSLFLQVEDSGPGIPPEILPRLGRPFERGLADARGEPGTGLGLALTRSFAEMHGGRLDLTSTVGVGTTATLALPLGPRPA